MSVTWAIVAAAKREAHMFTESRWHQTMYVKRRQAEARDTVGSGLDRSTSPAKRRLLEEQLVKALLPNEDLRRLTVEHRRNNEQARRELAEWIDRLTAEIYASEWTDEFEQHVRQRVAEIRQLADDGWGPIANAKSAVKGFKANATAGAIAGGGVAVVVTNVAPQAAKYSGLLIAGGAIGTAGKQFVDDLFKSRPQQRNAITYLHKIPD